MFILSENTNLVIAKNTKLTVTSNQLTLNSEIKGKGQLVLPGKNKQQLKTNTKAQQKTVIANLTIINADNIQLKTALLITQQLEIEQGVLTLHYADLTLGKQATLALNNSAKILPTTAGQLIRLNHTNHYYHARTLTLPQTQNTPVPSCCSDAIKDNQIAIPITSNKAIPYLQQYNYNTTNKILHPPPENNPCS